MMPSDCHANWEGTEITCDSETAASIPVSAEYSRRKVTHRVNQGDVAVKIPRGFEGTCTKGPRGSPSGATEDSPIREEKKGLLIAACTNLSNQEACTCPEMQSCSMTAPCAEIQTCLSNNHKIQTPLSNNHKIHTALSNNHKIQTPLSNNHKIHTALPDNHNLQTPLSDKQKNSLPSSIVNSSGFRSVCKAVQQTFVDTASAVDSVGDEAASMNPVLSCKAGDVHQFSSSLHGPVSYCVDENQNIASDEKHVTHSVQAVRDSEKSEVCKSTRPIFAKKMLPLRPSQSNGDSACVEASSDGKMEEQECRSNPLSETGDILSPALSRLTLEPNSTDNGAERMTQSCVLSEPCSLYGIESLPFELTQSEIILKPSSTDDHLLKVSSVPSDIFLGASSRTLTTDLFGQAESDCSLEQGSLRDIESLPASEINLASSLQTIRASSRETSPRLASNGGPQAWSTSSLEAESRKDKESLLSSAAPCQGLGVMGTDPEHADSVVSEALSQPQGLGVMGTDPKPADSVDSEALSQAQGHSDGGFERKHPDSVTPTVCSVSMEDVPDEVFLIIFSLLAQEDLCRHVTRVCKRWHRLAYDSTLWRKLDCSRWRSTGYQLQQIVLRIPGAIRWLDISAMDNLTLDDVAAVSVNCPELTYLDVGFVDDFCSDMLYLILMNCSKLCFLNVEGCRNANNEMMLTLAKTSGRQLRQLNFSHCSLTDESLTLLMKHMTGITHLNIDGISWISDEVVRQLASTYQDTLESLELDGNDLSDSTMEAVCGCQRLHTLSVSFCDDLSDRSVRHLLRLKQLEKLVLRKGLGLSAFAVTECFTSSVMQNLAYLDLTECQQLNDQGVQAIAQCCGRSVKTLNMAWCWLVTDRGVEAVAQHCLKMEKLYLTGLHRLEGAWLPVAVRNMKHLTYITFEQCNEVVDPVIEEAVREKHDLVILNYYGEVFIHRCQQ